MTPEDRRDYEKKWPGLPIKYLVLATDDYIVFIDSENDLDWKTTDEFDEKQFENDDQKKYNKIVNEIANIESIPCDNLDEKIVLNFKRQIGEALVRNFDRDFENAQKMLELAKDYIIDRSAEKSRFLYLKSSGITTLLVSSIGCLSWVLRDYLIELLGMTCFYAWLAFLIGAFGAMLSIILRMGKTNLDFHATTKLHYLEGISKIFAGMISALLVALCIKAGIIVPVINDVSSTHLAMIIGGLIAGASERLAPSIIKKIDGQKSK